MKYQNSPVEFKNPAHSRGIIKILQGSSLSGPDFKRMHLSKIIFRQTRHIYDIYIFLVVNNKGDGVRP